MPSNVGTLFPGLSRRSRRAQCASWKLDSNLRPIRPSSNCLEFMLLTSISLPTSRVGFSYPQRENICCFLARLAVLILEITPLFLGEPIPGGSGRRGTCLSSAQSE